MLCRLNIQIVRVLDDWKDDSENFNKMFRCHKQFASNLSYPILNLINRDKLVTSHKIGSVISGHSDIYKVLFIMILQANLTYQDLTRIVYP